MKLHTYYRSSASYRVRIALGLKQLNAEQAYTHLTRNGGEQFGAGFDALNPQHLLPVLEEDGLTLNQSLAIIEYLDETRPASPLLPADAAGRERVRALSQAIACEIHPLNNLRVLKYLSETLKVTPEQKNAWYRHWVKLGLDALEATLARDAETGRFCHGDMPTMADCCLIPQLYNARRFECDLSGYPTILRIEEACAGLPAFAAARPEAQPDAE
ncbi:maleylacetoacetate isomerase [Duganella sp. FT80W]|uniref:Maleylacetoacetate isomerase n=1 Tax=Duganella guangzhouensis TaxID=2666084 RepID=A0A6I2KYD8_9BURK|nr:maleylacetoacetate isomerase [Duganella guangzhouensis]MRW89216.1 maleylacetoacetate isomerase [Duganella guangzhouensis]